MKLNKRLFKIVTALVSTLLLALVVGQMHLSDEVSLTSGKTVKGKILSIREDGVRLQTASKEETWISREDIARDKKGEIKIERGVWIVLERAGDLEGLMWALLALFLLALPPIGGAVRWWVLLRMQGIELGMGRSVSLTYIGYLFNYVMLGLTGGDVVKAYYVTRETQRKTEAVVSVFMDRVVGLIALTVLGLIVVMTKVNDPNFKQVVLPIELFTVMGVFGVLVMMSRQLRRRLPETLLGVAALGGGAVLASRVAMMGFATVRTEVIIFAAVVVAFGLVVLSPARRVLQWEAIRHRLGANRMVREVDDSFHMYRKQPWGLGAMFMLSMVIHVLNVVGVYACGRALGIEQGLMTYMVLVPVIVMISSIPISVAGLGVQESLFPFFFGLPGLGVGANEAAMLAFLFRFGSSFLWVIPGWVLLLLWRGRPSVSTVEESALGVRKGTAEPE